MKCLAWRVMNKDQDTHLVIYTKGRGTLHHPVKDKLHCEYILTEVDIKCRQCTAWDVKHNDGKTNGIM